MYNCIFSSHCFEYQQCDRSCPTLAQTSYLLERNGIQLSSPVFKLPPESLNKYVSILARSAGKITTYISGSEGTNLAADSLTYCAICENWKGSQLHCTVYNLKFSQYIDAIQKSWSYNSENSESDYMKIWATTAKFEYSISCYEIIPAVIDKFIPTHIINLCYTNS